MTMLTAASSQLASRPDEQHFATFDDILSDASSQRAACADAGVADERVLFKADGTAWVGPLGEAGLDAMPLRFTRYAWEQVAILSGIPVGTLERLSPALRADVLNETFPRTNNDHDTQRRWLIERAPEGPQVRAILSNRYRRIWDAEILEEVGRWLIADSVGWQPAVAEINLGKDGTNIKGNRKPALFRSDRDSFVFFMSPREDGGDFGGLRRGIYVYNSEVGAASFGYSTFYFRAMCANFLIWDACAVRERRTRHVGQARNVYEDFRSVIRSFSPQLSDAELSAFSRAQGSAFLPPVNATVATDTWEERAALRLRDTFKLTASEASGAVEAMDLPENAGTVRGSVWSVVNGLTSYAKTQGYAATRVRLGKVAGQIMATAGV